MKCSAAGQRKSKMFIEHMNGDMGDPIWTYELVDVELLPTPSVFDSDSRPRRG